MKPMNIFLEVSSLNEDSEINSFHTAIDRDFAEFIVDICEQIAENGAYSVNYWYQPDTWSSYSLRETLSDEEKRQKVEEGRQRVELATLIIYEDSFRFTAIPKHFTEDCKLSTSKVMVSDLEKYFGLETYDL